MTMTEAKSVKPIIKSPPLDFDALLDEVRAASGTKPAITFVLGGETFVVPSPLDWPDELLELQSAAQQHPEAINVVAMARGILGMDQYERFVAAGGSAMKFQLVLPRLLGGNTGESSAS